MFIKHLTAHQRTAILIAAHDMGAQLAHNAAMEARAAARGRDYDPEDPETQEREDAAAAADEREIRWHSEEIEALRATMTDDEHAAAIRSLLDEVHATEAARSAAGYKTPWWEARRAGDVTGVSPLLLGAQECAWHANLAAGLAGDVVVDLHTYGPGWQGRPGVCIGGIAPLPTAPQLRAAHRLARALGHFWATHMEADEIVGFGDCDRTPVDVIAKVASEDFYDERASEAEADGAELDFAAAAEALEKIILAPTMDADDRIVHRSASGRISYTIDGEGVATISIHRPGLAWCRWRDRKAAQDAAEDLLVVAELEPGPEPERGDRVVLRATVRAGDETPGPVRVEVELVDAHAIRSRHAETLAALLFDSGLAVEHGADKLRPFMREGADVLGRRVVVEADRGVPAFTAPWFAPRLAG